MDLRLYINGSLIEIDESLIAPLSYSVADVKSPEKRSRNRSKTIKIKGTQANLRTMYTAYNLSIENVNDAGFQFNPNAELSARVTRNGYTIFQGVANYEQATFKKGVWEFDFKLFGISIGLFEQLGDMTLSDLDWSEYDHNLTVANLELSWNTSVVVDGVPTSNFTAGVPNGFGYVYHLANYGYAGNQLTPKTNELIPYIYMKEAFEKCFAVGGNTLIGDWIDTDIVKRKIFGKGGGERITLDGTEVTARRVNYSISGNESNIASSNISVTDEEYGEILAEFNYYKAYLIADISPNSITLVNDSRTQCIETNGVTTIQSTGTYNINLSFPITHSVYLSGTVHSFGQNIGMKITTFILVNGSIVNQSTGTYIGSHLATLDTITINTQKALVAGDEVSFKFAIYDSSGNRAKGDDINNPPVLHLDYTIGSASFDITSINVELGETDNVEIGRWIPDMKCRDFMNSIITMYNLYMSEPNADDEVRIEPFHDYYLGVGESENYTSKLDLSKPMVVKSNAGIEGEIYNFKWAEDMDGYHTFYKSRWGINYGDLEYQVPSTFKKGTKDYKVDFAQTIPINVDGLVIPQVVSKDISTGVEGVHKGKPRILIYNGLQTGNWSLLNSTTGVATAQTEYPQACHVDDVVTPTFDLNFGVPIEIYYTTSLYTTNNLFAENYDTQIKELTSQDSKFLEASFRLDESDLQGEFMRTLVNINGVVYRKNLIKDFNPAGYESTKMELIKLLEPTERAIASVPYVDPSGTATNNMKLSNTPSNDTRTTTSASGTLTKTSPNLIISDSTAGAKTATLSWEIPFGLEKTILRNGANIVTISAESSLGVPGTISGETSIILANDFDSATFVRDIDSGWLLKNYTSMSAATGGGALVNELVKTADYTLEDNDNVIYCDATAGAFTITYPATPIAKKEYQIIKIDSSAYAVTLDGNGNNINGQATQDLSTQFDSARTRYDITNTNWYAM